MLSTKHFALSTFILIFFNIVICAQLNNNSGQSEWYNDYDVKFYKIELNSSDTSLYIEGKTSIYCESNLNNSKIFTIELGQHLTIDSILYNYKKVSFGHTEDIVKVSIPDTVFKGKMMMFTIFYRGTVPSNGFFSGLSFKKDDYWQIPVVWSLSEPFRAKDWYPCKQYLPDKADSACIYITVPKNCKVGSNGLLKAIIPVDSDRICYKWQTNYPVAYYLISFTVGDFQEYSYYVNLTDRDSLKIQNYIYNKPGCLLKNKQFIDATGEYIKYYVSLFGEYPFMKEKYGHCLAPVQGGMEHQTMATVKNFNPDLVAHELAHQWFGDYVTCKSWQDIWINEGFASYCEYLSIKKFESQLAAQTWMDNAHSSSLNDSDGSVYVPDNDKNNEWRIFNNNLTYKKGASIIHQLRYEINNDTLFFSILRKFLKKYAYSVATGHDFENVVTNSTEQDYSWFFNQWYYGKGYPVYDFNWKQVKDTLYLYAHQASSAAGNNFFKMHFDVRLKFKNNDSLIRLYQEKKVAVYKIPIKNKIEKIVIDPDHWCIMKVLNLSKVSGFKFSFVNNTLIPKFEKAKTN